MVAPLDSDWADTLLNDANLEATTFGSGTDFPATWSTTRLFLRTDLGIIFKNVNTSGTPIFEPVGMFHSDDDCNWVDDFLTGTPIGGEVGKLNWGGVGAIPSLASSETNHPGIIQLNTTSVSGNIAYLCQGTTSADKPLMSNMLLDMTFLIRLPTITSITVLIGVSSDLQALSPTDCIYAMFDPAVNSHWQLKTRTAGAETVTATSLTVAASTWYKIRIYYSDATHINIFINDTFYVQHTTNLPTGAVNVGFSVKTNSAAIRSVEWDLFQMRIIGLTR